MLNVWKTGTAAHRRYVIRTFAFMIPYMLIEVAVLFLMFAFPLLTLGIPKALGLL